MGNGVSKISCTHQRFTSSDKKYRRKIVIDKRSIGGPYEFQHLAHIGADGSSENTNDDDHDDRPAPLASEVLRQQLAEITRALQELPTATHFQPHPATMRRSCTAGPLQGTMNSGHPRSVSRKPVAMPPRGGIASCNDIYGPTVRSSFSTRKNIPPANMPRHATVAHPGVVPRPSLQRWATGEHGDLGEKVQVEEDDLYEEDSEEESDEEDPTWIQPKPGMSNMKWLVESKIDAQLQKHARNSRKRSQSQSDRWQNKYRHGESLPADMSKLSAHREMDPSEDIKRTGPYSIGRSEGKTLVA